jgi:hypothetical protein
MTTASEHPPPAPGHQVSAAGAHLAAIAGSLAARGLASRLDVLGGNPVLTTGQAGAGPDAPAVAIDPDPGLGPVPRLDCTCTWTPAPRATAEAIAATVAAVLGAIRPPGGQPPAGTLPGPAAG